MTLILSYCLLLKLVKFVILSNVLELTNFKLDRIKYYTRYVYKKKRDLLVSLGYKLEQFCISC